jgi:ABC-type multidrug transport system fused ATPase/permease subunit
MTLALLAGWQAGIVSIGQVSAAIGQTFSLVGATWMFGFGVVMSADELGYIDDAIRMITRPHQITDAKGARPLAIGAEGGGIEFRDVSFTFGEQTIFSHMSLAIPPGQKVGLIGASGAGKSTLISLLLRLYDISAGEILIGGQNIAAVTQDSLRANIALIPQDTSLFHRSLADNIRYGRLDASMDGIEQAARQAHAHEFIARLPEGYATQVGERGIKLSAGQRQRIAIARAVLKDAPVLVLDEATSALDSESEKYIQDSLESLMQGKTVIAIAHRLSTIAHLDRLIVLDRGVIVEDGSHAELLARGGYYARLWSMQSGGFLAPEAGVAAG